MPRSLPLIAFQGEPGAFSHTAALKLLGSRSKVFPCQSFRDVFEALRIRKATYAVIPIENTLHGSIHENYDYLLEYEVSIKKETSVRISHHLIAMPGVSFRAVRRAFSHPVALNQCRRFFDRYKAIERTPFYDTAGSVKMLKEQGLQDAAAVASETSAEIYGGIILKRHIEDNRENFTRFFLLTKREQSRLTGGEGWKTSLVFSIPNEPSALFRAIACFALRDLNLTKLESRPLQGKPWEYFFYVDVIGHQNDSAMKSALTNLEEMASFVKVLGSYTPEL